ncbi:MAG: DUF2474 domain-containing protein [Gammaproteobacteria bacterium]|nr:DUF2474 domain-containing protein [Gammaproteobacteria bacterium]NNM00989.1 DUF2474 domain-containing protein [Gammaproteobacteria bacterium]
MSTEQASSSTWKRLGWFLLLWAASVATLGVIALFLRLMLSL